jgi:hypothetical protein
MFGALFELTNGGKNSVDVELLVDTTKMRLG